MKNLIIIALSFYFQILIVPISAQNNRTENSIDNGTTLPEIQVIWDKPLLENDGCSTGYMERKNTIIPPATFATISGIITDESTKRPLMYANIAFYQNDVFVTGTQTNLKGQYNISLKMGTYIVKYTYVGYNTNTQSIRLENQEQKTLDVAMKDGITLPDVVVTYAKNTNGSCCCTRGGYRYLAKETEIVKNNKEDSTNEVDGLFSKIYPNPTFHTLFIELEEDLDELLLVDGQGRKIWHSNNPVKGTLTVDLSNLPAATYYLRARKGDTVRTEKVVKLR